MTTKNKVITFTFELNEQEALDAAQFFKRVTFSEFEANAVNEDEAYRMKYALHKIRLSLNAKGFDPR